MIAPASSFPDPDELARLAALYGSGIVDGGLQEEFDALVGLAATLLDCPLAMLTLVGRDATSVRASSDGSRLRAPRCDTMCDEAIRRPAGLVIPDLTHDARYAGGPLVTAGLRFYAGVPVHAPDADGRRHPVGAICVTDTTPRALDAPAVATLRRLARLADALIEAHVGAERAVAIAAAHRRLSTDLERQHRIFGQAERMARIGSWRLSLTDEAIDWSEGVYQIYGLPVGTPPALDAALLPYAPDARARVSAALARTMESGEPFDFEEDFTAATGERRRVRCLGEREEVDGRAVAIVGVFQDITDRHALEEALREDAATDALTGLANRAAFDRTLEPAMERARSAGSPLLLALIDLDGFKAVNDTLGHAAGDDVLRGVGAALRRLAWTPLVAARVGGDEFALLIEDERAVADPDAAAALLGRTLRLTASGGGLTLACGATVGWALLDGSMHSPRDFLHQADVRLYAAKRARLGERRTGERRRAA